MTNLSSHIEHDEEQSSSKLALLTLTLTRTIEQIRLVSILNRSSQKEEEHDKKIVRWFFSSSRIRSINKVKY
jgi:hypothetical protein